LPFRDYVEWLDTRDYGRAKQVWVDELHGAKPRRLSATWTSYSDKSAADVGERHDLLDESSTAALREFGVRNRLTPSTILQSAWALVLAQVYPASDVVFGAVASMRPPELRDAETMLGLLVETMPVRVRIDPHQQVLHWLGHEQDRQVRLREYGYASTQRIHSWLGISPDDELFDTLFTYRNFPAVLSSAGAEVPPTMDVRVVEPPFTRRTGYAVVAAPKPGRELDLAIFYEREHVSESQAHEIIGRYGRIVRAIISDPYQAIGALAG
jgi:non-ribosomal peptide synthetase component F